MKNRPPQKAATTNLRKTAGLKPDLYKTAPNKLLRVQFDDQLLVDGRRLHIFTLGQSDDLGLELFAIGFEPRHAALALRNVAGFQDHGVLVHLFLDGDLFADGDLVRRDVDLLAGDADVAVQHELASLRT